MANGPVTAVAEEATEVRREEALLKTGALQDAIFNSANFSSIATDEKGVIQIFNVGAERMLGYAAADVVNKITPADISDPQELIARAGALSAELATTITPGFEALVFKASRGIEDIYELTYIRQDGSRFPAIVSVTALRDDREAIIGYLLIGTDNSARKQVEAEQMKLDQRLRDQQFYTRSLIESNIDAIMTTNPAGIITDVNKQMEALTGCTRDELIGAPFKNYFTDPERAEAGIKLVLREKKITDYELTACSREGKTTEVSYNATTFYDRDRKLEGVFAAARNITERKLLDQAMQEQNVELKRARAAAEKANLAKSDFLSSMSHELRSPLNAILGFAQLINSDSPPPTPAQTESIDQILHAGWYLLELINEILDLAQIESGKLALSQEPTSLAEVMLECQAMIEPEAQKRGILMTFPQFAVPCFVNADRTRLKQVLINLLSNAIKYNQPNGVVDVGCDISAPERVRISVKDKGISAALLSSMLLGALSVEFHGGTAPQEVLQRVNRLLCEKSLPFQFATLFLFVLSPDGQGQFISAGHNPVYVFRVATGTIEKLVSEAYLLGMFDSAAYPSRAFCLDKGDVLVVYSDGLQDAENRREEMFGSERLLSIIRQEAPSGSHALERSILKAIEEFTQGTPQTDDITFVIVERTMQNLPLGMQISQTAQTAVHVRLVSR